jgi:hypothetical protein
MIEPDLAFREAVETKVLRNVTRRLSRGRPTGTTSQRSRQASGSRSAQDS